jgi:hypothetical protein
MSTLYSLLAPGSLETGYSPWNVSIATIMKRVKEKII